MSSTGTPRSSTQAAAAKMAAAGANPANNTRGRPTDTSRARYSSAAAAVAPTAHRPPDGSEVKLIPGIAVAMTQGSQQ